MKPKNIHQYTAAMRPLLMIFMLYMGGFDPSLSLYGQDIPSQDTVFLYEEEITYDTLYIGQGNTDERMIQPDTSGVYLSSHRARIGVQDETLGKFVPMSNETLQGLLTPTDYNQYRQGRRMVNGSYACYVVGSLSIAVAAVGFSFFSTGISTRQPLFGTEYQKFQRGNFAMFACGVLVGGICLRAGVVINRRGKFKVRKAASSYNEIHHLAYAPPIRLSFSGTPDGIELTLNF
ncbi:MAG: hypothetical protein K6A95_00890 [Bacteroidales bacterium]|nr:hypothetical protein [Bacteroidales bacterium]